MPNIIEILAALQNLPRAYNAPPITPTFTGAPLPAGLPSTPLPLTTAGQVNPGLYGSPPPLSQDTAIANSIAPTAPAPPIDTNLIQQIMALSPPAPTPPTPPSRGQRIANALLGFSAGVGGNGAQFLAQLDEPQRIYQAQLQNYNQNRQQLGLTAIEAAQSKQQRQQERITRDAMAKSDREFELYKQNLGISGSLAEKQLEQAHDLAKFQMLEQMKQQQEAAKEKEAKEKQKREFAFSLVHKDYYPQNIADEIAAHNVDGTPLSTKAQNYVGARAKKLQDEDAKVQMQIKRLGRAGVSAGPPMAVLKDGTMVPLSQVNKRLNGVVKGEDVVPVVGYVGGNLPAQAAPKNPQAQKSTQDPLGIR